MSGASTSWHDLILYLIAQHAGPTAAQAVAKFFAFQWHADGLSPYIVFEPVTDHGDAAIDKAQSWLAATSRWRIPSSKPRASPGFRSAVSSGASRAPPGTRPSITFSGCAWKRRSGGSNERGRRWMRSAGRWVTKTRRFSAGYSKGSPASRPGRIGGSFTSPRLKSFEKRPASTFSWPTISANVMMRSATSSGCSTSFAVVLRDHCLTSAFEADTRKPRCSLFRICSMNSSSVLTRGWDYVSI